MARCTGPCRMLWTRRPLIPPAAARAWRVCCRPTWAGSSTNASVAARMARSPELSFPPEWHFDLLRGLEYFAGARAPWDERLADAVGVLESRRQENGRWKAENRHAGETFFALESGRGGSRMNTLRALRILAWVARARAED